MSEAPFMQLYIADYLGDTQHLTTEQHGAYLLILMAMWRRVGELPNDPAQLCRIARVSAKRWPQIAAQIMPFFDANGGQITQKRLKQERQKADRISEERKTAGGNGGRAKALKNKKPALASATNLPPPLLWHGQNQIAEEEEDTSSSLRSEDAPNVIQFPPPEPAQPPEPSVASDEERFWSFAAELQKKGVARSMLGKLANILDGSLDEGVGILVDVAAAKKPSAYLGAIIRERSRASPTADDDGDDGSYFDTTLGWIDGAGKPIERRASRSF